MYHVNDINNIEVIMTIERSIVNICDGECFIFKNKSYFAEKKRNSTYK